VGCHSVNAKHGIEPPLGPTENFKFKVLDSLVLSKIWGHFGGNLRHGYMAGVACPSEVLTFMDDLGVPILEGYSLMETR